MSIYIHKNRCIFFSRLYTHTHFFYISLICVIKSFIIMSSAYFSILLNKRDKLWRVRSLNLKIQQERYEFYKFFNYEYHFGVHTIPIVKQLNRERRFIRGKKKKRKKNNKTKQKIQYTRLILRCIWDTLHLRYIRVVSPYRQRVCDTHLLRYCLTFISIKIDFVGMGNNGFYNL